MFGDSLFSLRPLALACLVVLGSLARAQRIDPDPPSESGEIEAFAESDPWGGEDEHERLGYVRLGDVMLPGGVASRQVEELLGDIPMLWVETAHFRIGSTLKTYTVPGDPQERGKLRAEFEAMEDRMGGFKRPRNEIDPWMRLHLAAQRCEMLYAEFEAQFGLAGVAFGSPGAGMGSGPHLGQREKFVVLLFEKTASLARFSKRYWGQEQTFSARYGAEGGGWVFALSAETLRQNDYRQDAALHAFLAFGVVSNLCDGFRDVHGAMPLWFKYGVAHVASRRVDPRWNIYEGFDGYSDQREDAWEWEPRVRGLAANGVYPSFDAMLAWERWDDPTPRDHLIVWSRVDWLLGLKGGDPRAFLMALTEPPPEGALEVSPALRYQRQHAALEAAFGSKAVDLEKDWVRHVRRRYAR